MASPTPVMPADTAIVGTDGKLIRPWQQYLDAVTKKLADLEARLAALEAR